MWRTNVTSVSQYPPPYDFKTHSRMKSAAKANLRLATASLVHLKSFIGKLFSFHCMISQSGQYFLQLLIEFCTAAVQWLTAKPNIMEFFNHNNN